MQDGMQEGFYEGLDRVKREKAELAAARARRERWAPVAVTCVFLLLLAATWGLGPLLHRAGLHF